MDALVTDDLWAVIAPLLPPEPGKPKGGRPRASDRAALAGIILVLRTSMQWKHLPRSAVGCSGKTSWLRLGAWQAAGVWVTLYRALLERLQDADALDWSRGPRQRQPARQKGGAATGPNPTDRGKPGTKRHLVVGARGMPLGVTLTGANRQDSRMLAATLDAVPGVRTAQAFVAARGAGRTSCTPTRPTTTVAAAGSVGRAASRRASPGAVSRAANAWVGTAGSWNGPWRGWPASAGLPSATSAAPTCIWP